MTREPEAALRRDLYLKIFDPANCPLQENERLAFVSFEDEIREKMLQEVMDDLWAEEYREVKKMLERTRKNPPPDYKELTNKKNDQFSTKDFSEINYSLTREDVPDKSHVWEIIRQMEKCQLIEGSVCVIREI